jgi:SPX domain protein involved in polyphosphate accumulation
LSGILGEGWRKKNQPKLHKAKKSTKKHTNYISSLRYEFKYFVPEFRLSELRSMILPFVRPDKFAALHDGNQYTVRSIYFDTSDFQMYHTKRDHLAHRMKVRLRGYNEGGIDNPVFFEIKRKYEGPILKNRATLPFSSVQQIFRGASMEQFLPETNKADNVRRFFYQIHKHQLQPAVNVIYEREVYLSNVEDKDNDLRISLDKNLRSVPCPSVDELYKERDVRYVTEGHFILEIKFNRYCPAWIRPILATMDLQKGPASKYIMCIDSQPIIRTNHKFSLHYQAQTRLATSKPLITTSF